MQAVVELAESVRGSVAPCSHPLLRPRATLRCRPAVPRRALLLALRFRTLVAVAVEVEAAVAVAQATTRVEKTSGGAFLACLRALVAVAVEVEAAVAVAAATRVALRVRVLLRKSRGHNSGTKSSSTRGRLTRSSGHTTTKPTISSLIIF